MAGSHRAGPTPHGQSEGDASSQHDEAAPPSDSPGHPRHRAPESHTPRATGSHRYDLDPHSAGRYAHKDMDDEPPEHTEKGDYTDLDTGSEEHYAHPHVGGYTDRDLVADDRPEPPERSYTDSEIPEGSSARHQGEPRRH